MVAPVHHTSTSASHDGKQLVVNHRVQGENSGVCVKVYIYWPLDIALDVIKRHSVRCGASIEGEVGTMHAAH